MSEAGPTSISSLGLVLRNLRYYWLTNLAVIAAVIAGTAVIGGALVVGDSVRGSLRQMSLDRLGRVDDVLTGMRFFREDLAQELAVRPAIQERFSAIAPSLMVGGIFLATHDDTSRRAGGVQVFGTDERLWGLLEHGDVPVPRDHDVVLNARLAGHLGVKPGDSVSLWISVPSTIPRESLLGKREGEFHEIPLTVLAILHESSGAGRLTLNPTQQLPFDAFVPILALQEGMGLEKIERSRRNPTGAPARVNALFASARSAADQIGSTATDAAKLLDREMSAVLTPTDIGLRLVINSKRGYVSVESDQQILDDSLAAAALDSSKKLGLTTSPVLAYLANELINVKEPKKLSVYSIVAGLDPVTLSTPPFGPFVWASAAPEHPLAADEIVLNDRMAADLGVKANGQLRMRYHLVGSHGELPEEERIFRVAGILNLEGTPAADPGLVPEVKGITDAKTIADWQQPFPMKLNLVTKRDEDYWDKYRATPKSFVSLETAQKLWGSRFGKLTSVRVAPKEGQTLEQTATAVKSEILKTLTPEKTRMQFQPVKFAGVTAAVGSNDFSQLFLGFSFFLILAAAMLVGLVVRLGIERRGTSIGLLSAIGFTPRRLRRNFLAEGMFLVLIGGLLGTAVAVGYAALMILGLKLWWNQAVGTQFLSVYVDPMTLATGFISSVVVAALAVLWGLRQLRRLSPRELLSGATEPALTVAMKQRRSRRSLIIGVALLAISVLILIAALSGRFAQGEAFEGLSWSVVLFFLDGIALLIAGVMLIAGTLEGEHSAAVAGHGAAGIARLGVRNMARHRQRSTASVSLIAAATFLIVAVAAGRRNPAVETPVLNSGNGGFRLVGESTQPILPDLNTPAGREKVQLTAAPGSSDADLPAKSRFFAFRVRPGENASCLNIYQTRLPTILGVPKQLIDRGGFRFIGAHEPNPWTQLEQTTADGAVPVFGDANTLQYSLHKEVGETVDLPAGPEGKRTMKIAGMLDGSVFQGVLLMSEDNFRRLFPNIAGYEYFLIEVPGPAASGDRLAALLETQLTPYGFEAESVSERLANFLAVQNTYLSTFQTLGGLGLLLGTLGLATVMVRNVLERRSELALLSALGFRRSGLAWLVLVETAVLLLCGLLIGTIAALVAMVPHISSIGADVPWASLALILSFVFVVGMLAALAASIEAARTRILEGLRSE
jgi:putative ABC transport system permease protein